MNNENMNATAAVASEQPRIISNGETSVELTDVTAAFIEALRMGREAMGKACDAINLAYDDCKSADEASDKFFELYDAYEDKVFEMMFHCMKKNALDTMSRDEKIFSKL